MASKQKQPKTLAQLKQKTAAMEQQIRSLKAAKGKPKVNRTVAQSSIRKELKAEVRALAKAGGGGSFKMQSREHAYDYVKAIVDPEGSGLNAGVPDEYMYPTSRYQSINEWSLGGTGVGQLVPFDGGNTTTIIMTPDPYYHVYLPAAIGGGTVVSCGSWKADGGFLKRTDGFMGQYPQTNRLLSASLIPDGSNTPMTFAGVGVPAPEYAYWRNPPYTGWTAGSLTSLIVGSCSNAAGTATTGIPVTGSSDVVACDVVFTNISGSGTLVATFNFSNAAGGLVTGVSTSAAGATVAYLYVTAPATAVRYTGISFTSGVAGPTSLIDVNVRINYNTAQTVAQTGSGGNYALSGRILGSYAVPEYSTFATGAITARRCVSSSMWIQYDGGVLNDNGRLVACDISARTSPFNLGQNFCDIQSLSALKLAYDGQLPKGLYSVWVPETSNDIMFRGFNEEWTWSQPYNVAQLFQPTAAGQQVRLRIVTNWEFQTHSNLYQRMQSVVDPDQIAFAHKILAGFPRNMENPEHLQAILGFLRDAGKKLIGNAGKIGTAIGSAFGPHGAMIGTGAGQLVQGLGKVILG